MRLTKKKKGPMKTPVKRPTTNLIQRNTSSGDAATHNASIMVDDDLNFTAPHCTIERGGGF